MDHLYNKRVAYHTGCIPVFWFAIAKRGRKRIHLFLSSSNGVHTGIWARLLRSEEQWHPTGYPKAPTLE
jgi:hypothetical protein